MEIQGVSQGQLAERVGELNGHGGNDVTNSAYRWSLASLHQRGGVIRPG